MYICLPIGRQGMLVKDHIAWYDIAYGISYIDFLIILGAFINPDFNLIYFAV
jgi:hypothetical protein